MHIKTARNFLAVFDISDTDISERAGAYGQFHNAGVLEGLEVPLGDVDVLVAQQTGEGVDIQTITQIRLGIVVAGSVRRTADFIPDHRLGSGLFENMLQCFLGQRVAGAGEEEVSVGDDLVIEVKLLDPQVLDQELLEIGSQGNVTFLVALSMNQDHVVPNVLFLNRADFGVSGTGVKGDGKDQLVPGRQIGGHIEGIQKGADFVIGEGVDQYLALPLPADLK